MPLFMLARSSHACVRARWIIACPFLLDTRARWIPMHACPCPVDPHARTSVPTRSPHTHACWIPMHARLCPLDPRMPVPAGSPHAHVCWIPACPCPLDPHACLCPCPPDPHACPCPCLLDPHARTHTSTRPMHAHRMCTHGPQRARSYGPDARSLVGPPCTHVVSPHSRSRTPHPWHAYMRLLDVSCMHP